MMAPWSRDSPQYGAFIKATRTNGAAIEQNTGQGQEEVYSPVNVEVISNCCYADPVSNRGRVLQMFRAIALMLIPLMALVSLACYWMVTNVIVKSDLENDKVMVNRGQTVGSVAYALQLERATVVYALEEKDLSLVGEQYKATDAAIRESASFPTKCFNDSEHFIRQLWEHRRQISMNASSRTTHDEVGYYSRFTNCFLEVLMGLAKDMNHGSVWQDYVSYKMLLKAQESVGVLLSIGITFFEDGYLPLFDYNLLRTEDVAAREYIEIALLFSPFAAARYEEHNRTKPQAFKVTKEYRQFWQQNNFSRPSAEEGRMFHKSAMDYFKILSEISGVLSKKIIDQVDKEIATSINMMVVACMVFICVLIMTPILVKLMHTLTMSIQNYAIEASHKSQQLIIEKQRSDSLLYQMLPKSVAQQLKMHTSVNAEYYEQVTLFFSDIVSFTEISAASTPLQVVILLNKLYQIFDDILDHYDVYKVETIGDAYMVVSGLPNRNGSAHCAEISLMALELLKTTRDFPIPHMPGRTVELRIGCHSGSAVAGVVGNKMPRYCLFGDTVNTASRMESHGLRKSESHGLRKSESHGQRKSESHGLRKSESHGLRKSESHGLPNRIHISQAMNTLLDQIQGFITERRGIVDIKGKGEMLTFWLTGTSRPLRSLASNGMAMPDVTASLAIQHTARVWANGSSVGHRGDSDSAV
ncbi:uncharacterized protein LOC131944018 [Physella acuta]|uniref:uncharacterized protein LOC131944018 n=1 Tax=Physella acuta TaxID=109671 RepID=UPI0027DB5787|nr:uncharacterized protein LOC131944018 [Physella acuta]